MFSAATGNAEVANSRPINNTFKRAGNLPIMAAQLPVRELNAMDYPTTKEELDILLQAVQSDPTNLVKATRYWEALRHYEGSDVRSGRQVMKAFRIAALNSRDGAVALSRAYQELVRLSGEGPRPVYFDSELIEAMRKWVHGASDEERSAIVWVLDHLNLKA